MIYEGFLPLEPTPFPVTTSHDTDQTNGLHNIWHQELVHALTDATTW